MHPVIQLVQENLLLTVIGVTCLIQISPIKINPWSAIMKSIKKYLVGDLMDEVQHVKSEVANANKEISNERVQRIRWNILDFTNSCRRGTIHTREEWDHCIDELKWYVQYCQDKDIQNGVIEQSAIWLHRRYHDHLDKDDFLKD